MKSKLAYYIFSGLLFVILEFGLNISTVDAGNDIVLGGLRVDQSIVADSEDYTVFLQAYQIPTTSGGFTTNWLSIAGLDNNSTFTQVGLIGWSDGLRWFVYTYSNMGLTCLRGSGYVPWGYAPNGNFKGCRGDINDLVGMNEWHKVELVSYDQGYWIARVNDIYGVAHDVAQIWIGSVSTIYSASVSVEEGYDSSPDPHLSAGFYQYLPQYMVWGSGFTNWPQSTLPSSSTNKSWLAADNSFCPSYYSASVNYTGNEWGWYGGNAGNNICDWILFPPVSSSGTYDDSSTSLVDYEPVSNWSHQTNISLAMWSTISKSSTNAGDRARFTFNGNTISYFYSTGVDRGIQNIYLDGNYLDTLYSHISNGYRRQIGKTWSVSSSDHTIEIVNNGGSYTDVDAFAVNIATVGAGTYDDTNSQLRYIDTGTWSAHSGISGAYNGTEHWSSVWGSLMRFTFTGSSITYCYSTAYNRAIAGVTIDGITEPDLDLYSPTVQRHVCTTYSNLDNSNGGIHIINIMNTGYKNSRSSDIFISVDDLVVQ